MEFVIVLLTIGLGAAIAMTVARRRRSSRSAAPRFRSRRKLLTDDQLVFFDALESALNGQYRIVMKVGLNDILVPHESLEPGERVRLREWMGRIGLDCVLCDDQTFEVLAAIKLERNKRRDGEERDSDRLLADALRSANVHLIRIARQASYSAAVLAVQIESILSRDFIETLTLTASQPDGGGETGRDEAAGETGVANLRQR